MTCAFVFISDLVVKIDIGIFKYLPGVFESQEEGIYVFCTQTLKHWQRYSGPKG